MYTPRPDSNDYNNVVRYRNDGDFYFSCGVKAFKRKRFERAEKWLLKAVETSPKNALFLCQLSVLYTEIGHYHRANGVLQEVIDYHGNEYVDCYYLLANNFAHLGLFDEARRNAYKYLDIAPDGDFKQDVKRLLELLDHVADDDEFDEDLDFDVDDEDELIIYQETAFFHLERKEWDDAIEILEELMLVYPEYIPAKHEYAFALFEKGDKEEALALENAWFEHDPTSLHSRLNLIYFYNELGEEERVAELRDTLINVYPTYETQKLKLAITFAKVNMFEQSLYRFQIVDKLSVMNYPSYFYWYSKVLKENGLIEESEKVMQEGVRKHPILSHIVDD
ncbi:tetratricopeptide repeat protein [Bacillaceae bacterium W0354]